jgi:hypothetical protein
MQLGSYKKYIILFFILQILVTVAMNYKLRQKMSLLVSEINLTKSNNVELKNCISNIYNCHWSFKQKKYICTNNEEIKETVKEEAKVFCIINKNMCKKCVFSVLQDLSILEKELGYNKVVILKESEINIDSYGFNTIKIDSTLNPLDNINTYPLIFILNKELDIMFSYSEEWYPELYETYFREILTAYFKSL